MSSTRAGAKYKGLEIDVRTDTMSTEVLMCRSMNHPWQRVPTPPARRTELLKQNLVEWQLHCLRCGSTKFLLLQMPDFALVSSQIKYCSDYLMANKYRGQGRLPLPTVRRAMYVRDDPDLS